MKRLRCGVPALALVLVAGCGGGTSTESEQPTAAPLTNESTEGLKPAPVTLDVTIIDGELTPRGARVELKVGQRLTINVNADVDDEIHVHNDPEQTLPVKAGKPTSLTLSVDKPGTVVVELHELDAVVAELLVRK